MKMPVSSSDEAKDLLVSEDKKIAVCLNSPQTGEMMMKVEIA